MVGARAHGVVLDQRRAHRSSAGGGRRRCGGRRRRRCRRTPRCRPLPGRTARPTRRSRTAPPTTTRRHRGPATSPAGSSWRSRRPSAGSPAPVPWRRGRRCRRAPSRARAPQRDGRLQPRHDDRAHAGFGALGADERRDPLGRLAVRVARQRRAERVVAVEAGAGVGVELGAAPWPSAADSFGLASAARRRAAVRRHRARRRGPRGRRRAGRASSAATASTTSASARRRRRGDQGAELARVSSRTPASV